MVLSFADRMAEAIARQSPQVGKSFVPFSSIVLAYRTGPAATQVRMANPVIQLQSKHTWLLGLLFIQLKLWRVDASNN